MWIYAIGQTVWWRADQAVSGIKTIRDTAVKENASETVKAIDEEIMYIKLMLKPLTLPEDEHAVS